MSRGLRNLGRPVHAGVILTKGVTEMLDVAPFEAFAWMTRESLATLGLPETMVQDGIDFQLHWVTEDGDFAQMRCGAQIKATDSFESCPPLDIALMGAHDIKYHINEAEKVFIKKSFDNCSAFLTMCGGIFALLEADVLGGLTATAPRMAFKVLRQAAPHVNWVDKRWVHDGKLWSSSTLLNSTDCMRAFMTEIWGNQNGAIEALMDAGHWPERDVDFKDFHGSNYMLESF